MCGIVGAVGTNKCGEVLFEGLRRLEYRGYDSAGIATLGESGEVSLTRRVGKLGELGMALEANPQDGHTGIGHTRWATHGAPTERNAHPHQYGATFVVHNGIIENYRALKQELRARGHEFASDTDSEVVAHLVEDELAQGKDLLRAVQHALLRLEGSYAVAVMNARHPNLLVVARQKSPLVVGLGEGENFIASDVPALLSHTRMFLFLNDGEIGVLTPDRVALMNLNTLEAVYRKATTVQWTESMTEKGGYRHYMLKEIHEQPKVVEATFRSWLEPRAATINMEMLAHLAQRVRRSPRMTVVACGTSYHAALLGRWYLETMAGLPVDIAIASEYRYRNPLVLKDEIVVAVSQSGETADTLAAAAEARSRGAEIIAICNSHGSSLTRMADATLQTLAGPEIGVASTKAFTCQVAAFYSLALWAARERQTLPKEVLRQRVIEAFQVPGAMAEVLSYGDSYRTVARKYLQTSNMLYLGRGLSFPIALEGALKLKELSYIHAEGYPAGEMKHGPIALIEPTVPSLFVVPKGPSYEKVLSNIEEIRSRGGPVLVVTTGNGEDTSDLAEDCFVVPPGPQLLEPLLTVLPVQLFAYHVSNLRGCDVDQPRNLAKSVTVE